MGCKASGVARCCSGLGLTIQLADMLALSCAVAGWLHHATCIATGNATSSKQLLFSKQPGQQAQRPEACGGFIWNCYVTLDRGIDVQKEVQCEAWHACCSALSLTRSAMLAVACAEKGRYFIQRIWGKSSAERIVASMFIAAALVRSSFQTATSTCKSQLR